MADVVVELVADERVVAIFRGPVPQIGTYVSVRPRNEDRRGGKRYRIDAVTQVVHEHGWSRDKSTHELSGVVAYAEEVG